MLTKIRRALPEQDYQSLSALLSTFRPEPFTPNELVKTDQERQKDGFLERYVAESETGEIIGYGVLDHDNTWSENSFFVWTLVAEAYRQQALGSKITEVILQRATEVDVAELFTDIRDNDTVALKFAEKHGFVIRNHIFESTIELKYFDVAQFADLSAEIETQGIVIKSLAELGNTEDMQYKLWNINYAVAMDIPDRNNDFLSWENFQTKIIASDWFDPTMQILALKGDEAVGIHALRYVEETQSMYNLITGVSRAYRGRKIAQALKLYGILLAKSRAITYIRTHNHAKNRGMLAINAKMGFKPEVGYYDMVKSLI